MNSSHKVPYCETNGTVACLTLQIKLHLILMRSTDMDITISDFGPYNHFLYE